MLFRLVFTAGGVLAAVTYMRKGALNHAAFLSVAEAAVAAAGGGIGRMIGGLNGARNLLASKSNQPNATKTSLQKAGVGFNKMRYDVHTAIRFRPQTLLHTPAQPPAATPSRPPEAAASAAMSEAKLVADVTQSAAPPPPAGTQSAGDIFADFHRERRHF